MKSHVSITPRLLTKEQAAAYCGVSAPTFASVCPVAPLRLGESNRNLRYDIRALDKWIDRMGGVQDEVERDWLAAMDQNNEIRDNRKRH
ncbi:hypothetical protein M2321_003875 [Rhodoblastus acidophilus]|nr:hypothetical protein [Rhodoblastus acidophilus]